MRSISCCAEYGIALSSPALLQACFVLQNEVARFDAVSVFEGFIYIRAHMKFPSCLALILLLNFSNSQTTEKARLIAGPVIGAVTKNSAKIWIAYRGKGENALILGDTAEKKVYYPTHYSYIANAKGEVALTMDFTGLRPDHRYNILVSIEGW